jgi:hypothetical protein
VKENTKMEYDLSDLDLFSKPISGKDLLRLYPYYFKEFISNKVYDSPTDSLKVISDLFQQHPNTSGSNIIGINDIRNIFFDINKKEEECNALTIVAPHTHWSSDIPINYSFDETHNRYIVGPQTIDYNVIYRPVSFVFLDKFPVPYEWVDNTILINDVELQRAYELIYNLNIQISTFNYPLGIAINFRFKDSLFDEPEGSVEIPIVGERENDGLSNILTFDNFTAQKSNDSTEQVSWSIKSEKFLSINNEEFKLLQEIRKLMDSKSDTNNRVEIFNLLKNNSDS